MTTDPVTTGAGATEPADATTPPDATTAQVLSAQLRLQPPARLGVAADPSGWLRRGLGRLFIVVGTAVLTGADRVLQARLVEHAPVAPCCWTACSCRSERGVSWPSAR